MKKIIIFLSLLFHFSNAKTQTTEHFTRTFETSTGIYGEVHLKTRPITVGSAYLWVEQEAVIFQGVKGERGDYSSSDLVEEGITFPYACSNCFFYADGEAKMNLKGTTYYGPFNKEGIIAFGENGKTNHRVYFSEEAKRIHNEIEEQTDGVSMWETTGSVERIEIYDVKGGDLGKITRAVEQHEQHLLQQEQFNSLISDLETNLEEWTPEKSTTQLNEAKRYARTNKDWSKINELSNEIEQKKKELAEAKQKETNNETTTSQSSSQRSSTETNNTSPTTSSTNAPTNSQNQYETPGLGETAEADAYSNEAAIGSAVGTGVGLITMIPDGDLNYVSSFFQFGRIPYIGLSYGRLYHDYDYMGWNIMGAYDLDFKNDLGENGRAFQLGVGLSFYNPYDLPFYFTGFELSVFWSRISNLPFEINRSVVDYATYSLVNVTDKYEITGNGVGFLFEYTFLHYLSIGTKLIVDGYAFKLDGEHFPTSYETYQAVNPFDPYTLYEKTEVNIDKKSLTQNFSIHLGIKIPFE